jgi:hypothetical protein
MGGISTFQATTTTATGIFSLFSCFLEAVAVLFQKKCGVVFVAQKRPRFPQRNLSHS